MISGSLAMCLSTIHTLVFLDIALLLGHLLRGDARGLDARVGPAVNVLGDHAERVRLAGRQALGLVSGEPGGFRRMRKRTSKDEYNVTECYVSEIFYDLLFIC